MSPEEHKHILRTGLATVVGLVVITLLDNLSWWVPVIGLVLAGGQGHRPEGGV